MSKFQVIILSIFVLFIIVGVVAFATYKGTGSNNAVPPITIWGTFPANTLDDYLTKINNTLQDPIVITYVQKSQAQFSGDFIAALARGTGPDAILVPADILLPHYDKVALIPYSALPQRTFIDTYIQEADTYLTQDGVLALPFTINPLVMYWNRDTFDTAGIATYPRFWDEFTELNKKLTVKDDNGNIRKSAVALGTFSNIVNAREILGTLFMQTGNPITTKNSDGTITSTFKSISDVSAVPALTFFTKSVNPTSVDYSWNRSLPDSKTAFLSGNLATYFGFASEIGDIRTKNPNLNFDVALLPQVRKGGVKTSYGKMFAFSIVKASLKLNTAFQDISTITSSTYLAGLSNATYLPSVRRDVINQGSKDPYISIFNDAALVAKTWVDADPVQSNRIFSELVESVVSSSKTMNQAIQDAGDEYDVN